MWLIQFLLKNLSIEKRNRLISLILGELKAAPLRDIITIDDLSGTVFINGEQPEMSKASQLRESARLALSNPAMKLVWDQTLYEAFKIGVSVANNDKDILFAKTAIWNGENERRLLRLLAQEDSTVG